MFYAFRFKIFEDNYVFIYLTYLNAFIFTKGKLG